jgi:catechol 2,3-dioxygenase-like lactoylglutathione lyase family enzyme
MGISVTKDSIDLGIVVRDADSCLVFYRDVLGLAYLGHQPMPGGASMHRLVCGTSQIKLVTFSTPPQASNPLGGINAASGYRYWTISVPSVADMVAACERAGAPVRVPATEIRPGITIAMVEDPEGNWVEFLEVSG